MRPFKLPHAAAPLDALIAYVTDVNPLLREHRAYFVEHHAEGEVFAQTLVTAGMDLLAKSATADLSAAEAEAATAAHAAEMANARALVDEVRRRGRYLIGELSSLPGAQAQANARAVRIACAIGSRVSVTNQTGLRKLLALQRAGLDEVHAVFDAFKQPDLRPRLLAASEALNAALEHQARQQAEARLAHGERNAAVRATALALRRALRFLNAMGEHAPEALRVGLRSCEGGHPAVFRSAKKARRGAKEPVEPE